MVALPAAPFKYIPLESPEHTHTSGRESTSESKKAGQNRDYIGGNVLATTAP